jgi:hypothetical protein
MTLSERNNRTRQVVLDAVHSADCAVGDRVRMPARRNTLIELLRQELFAGFSSNNYPLENAGLSVPQLRCDE